MSFLTFRRYYLDKFLLKAVFYGRVLDVGGKKDNKRGKFRPPLQDVYDWEYLNIDPNTRPDYCCGADCIPVEDNVFDIILLTEVLEHLENPLNSLEEVKRVLKEGGKIIVTIPFMYPLHADPYDFQRWTSIKLRLELSKLGFKKIMIEPMGSTFAVIYDIVYSSLTLASKKPQRFRNRFIRKFILPLFSKFFLVLDRKYMYKSKHITTGYYIEAIK